jgi:hypothetical protein
MLRFVANGVLVTVPRWPPRLIGHGRFALAKHRFTGNRALLMIFVAGGLVPFQC